MDDRNEGPSYTVVVPEGKGGTRLDRWLAEAVPDLSRSRLKALIETGRVEGPDGVAGDPSAKVRDGQAYRVRVPPVRPAEPVAQNIGLSVAYEDAHLVVIDKPAGLVVHPAAGNPDGTLVNALLGHCGESLSGVGGVARPGIVHRLDKDTSGLIVVAKDDPTHHGLARQFAEHSLERAYLAVVWGVPVPTTGEIRGNIGRSPADRKKMAVVARGGKTALTRYRVVRAFGTVASLVECRLATGRTHQIRVHMAASGHPVVGDLLYGADLRRLRGRPESLRAAVAALDGQALHAFLIGFFHPATGEKRTLTSEIPLKIKELIREFEAV